MIYLMFLWAIAKPEPSSIAQAAETGSSRFWNTPFPERSHRLLRHWNIETIKNRSSGIVL